MSQILLLLLAMPVRAQDVPFYNRSLETEQDTGAINRNFQEMVELDRRHNLTKGGTVDGDLDVTQITWPDGTVQISSPPAPTAAIVSTGVVFGNPGSANYINNFQIAYNALSIDGASQSSGCVTAVFFQNTGAANANLVFTSTTSAD